MANAQQLLALAGRQAELSGTQLDQSPAGTQLGQLQWQGPPARDRHRQRHTVNAQQALHERQRVVVVFELLGVVDDHDQRLDQQLLDVGDQRSGGRPDVDRLQAGREPIARDVGEAGDGGPHPLHRCDQEPTGLSAREPHRAPLGELDRLLQRHRLAVARAGHEQDVPGCERMRQRARKRRACNPGAPGP